MLPTRFRALALVLLLAGVSTANAQVVYQVENILTGTSHEIFNNSQTSSDTEDCWVANAFQVVASGTQINSVTFLTGSAFASRPVTISIYMGSSLTNPQAGGGLVRIASSTTTVNLASAADTFQTINFNAPVSLPVGQIFYASILMPTVAANVFPFSSDAGSTPAVTPLGRSFFDVGATQGAAYNLDDTTRATVLGASHPVVTFAQSPGNLGLRVNAVPEPGSMTLVGTAVVGIGAWIRRRRMAKVA